MPNREKAKDFIKKLQEKDEKTKRVYLVAASSVSMIVIILLWVLYLNFTVPTVGQGNATSTATPTTTIDYIPRPAGNTAGNSFLDTLGRGFSNVSDGLVNGVGDIAGQIGSFVSRLERQIRSGFQKTNTFNIQGEVQTTTPTFAPPATTTLEAIPTTTLP
jgi:hypothetical protein